MLDILTHLMMTMGMTITHTLTITIMTTTTITDMGVDTRMTNTPTLTPISTLTLRSIRRRCTRPSALFALTQNMIYALIPPHRHSGFDLIMASIQTVATFALAYPAAVNLGAVLLQTAPARGLPGGRMEAFLRAMREIEGHSQVLHLPAPHIWQLTPTLHAPPASSYPSHLSPAFTRDKLGASQNLVVTVDLHIRKDMPPREAIALMKWATERCQNALRLGVGDGKGGECDSHVTVGVVRG
ncbi:hypothetical protein EUX98_g1551 [Antrodiella citrinella]|uniref:Uncharacterized protein n=1 Tax=Antrodiella citrinella TaxID=2447956 RepID=A0A4S4N3I0_9APHY|nr:hypothetical protein EUX98_g1551 [Antrodiella citrinella]